ncbi:MAG: hypothetical protein WC565_05785 [Parcubacteria group bacterium]
MLQLDDGDYIVTAWAESCSGPGWANQLVNVLVLGRNGKLRMGALQPHEQTADMQSVFRYSAMAAEDMRRAVSAKLKEAHARP